jgi:peptide/nickel transport system substrate-binding protein
LPAGLALPAAHAADQEDTSNSLIIAVNQSVDTFNPFKSRFVITYNTRLLTYETLIRTGADDYAPTPGLATDWEASEDGLTWTFTIRDDSVWSDGEPVTAHDAAYTYQLLMENEGIRDWNIDFAGNLAGVEAPDDTTLIIRLNEPSTDILTAELCDRPRHIWETYDDPSDDLVNDELPMVGSGS